MLTAFAARLRRHAGALLTAAVALACAGSLLLPAVWGAYRQQALLGQVLPRPAVAGVPAEEARAVPILYDLYRTDTGESTPGQPAADPAAALRSAEGHLRALEGVLPEDALEQLSGWLASLSAGETQVWAGEGGGFAWVECSAGRQGLRLTWHQKTGGILELSAAGWPGAEKLDTAALLAAWQESLGLDVLDDWTPVSLGGGTACRSEKAQAYQACRTGPDGLWMELIQLPGEN